MKILVVDDHPLIQEALTQLLPQWTLDGGIDGMLALLTDTGRRAEIAVETVDKLAQTWKAFSSGRSQISGCVPVSSQY